MAMRRLGLFRRGSGGTQEEAASATTLQPATPPAPEGVNGEFTVPLPPPAAGDRLSGPAETLDADTSEWVGAPAAPAPPKRAAVAEPDLADTERELAEAELEPTAESEADGDEPAPSDDDVAERIRIATQKAAEAAQQRAMAEILALDEDLDRAKARAAKQLEALEAQFSEAERRVADAEANLEHERGEKAAIIEASNRRLEEVERHAAAVASRVAAAEQELAEETERLRRQAEQRIAEQTAPAREEAGRPVRAATDGKPVTTADGKPTTNHRFPPWGHKANDKMEQPSAAPESSRGASIAELATEAEKVAEDSVAAPVAEHDLEPPDWVSEAPESAEVPEGTVSLSAVSFERLRELGLSVTQSKRVLKYRDEHGFTSVDDLENVPGFPQAFLAELKGRVVP